MSESTQTVEQGEVQNFRALSEVLEFVRNGLTVKQNNGANGLPITRIETISEGTIDNTRVGFADLDESDCEDWLLKKGDILLSHINSIPHIGKCALYQGEPEKLVHGMNLLCLRTAGKVITPEYLVHYFKTKRFKTDLLRYVNPAVNQASVSITNLVKVRIPVPSLPEQRRIATILDKADAIRRKRRQAIDLMNDFLRSVFLEMFGDPISNPLKWPEIELAKLLQVPPRIGTIEPANDGGNLIVIRVGELGGINPELARSKKVSLPSADRERFKVNSGDILLARAIGSEEQLGKSSIFEDIRDDVVFDSHVMRLRFNSSLIVPLFFLHFFKTDQGKARVLKRGGRTAVQFNINASQLSDVTIPLPPLALQNKFVSVCRKQSDMLKKAELAAREGHALFESLANDFFLRANNGGVDPICSPEMSEVRDEVL